MQLWRVTFCACTLGCGTTSANITSCWRLQPAVSRQAWRLCNGGPEEDRERRREGAAAQGAAKAAGVGDHTAAAGNVEDGGRAENSLCEDVGVCTA
jgi:hypothetical protein